MGRRLLFLVHDRSSSSTVKLPEMAGLVVERRERNVDDQLIVSVTLENAEDADIFARLCEDIIEFVASSEDAVGAVTAFIQRTWKWHSLLKGKRRAKLSLEAQLGLIGELWTLREVLAPWVGLDIAVESWRGSEGAPKDFELSSLCIECKSRGASSRAKVRITSEHQLDDVPGQQLFLMVHVFAACDETAFGALNLHDMASSLLRQVEKEAPKSLPIIEVSLDEAGYDPTHEYNIAVAHRTTDFFEVCEAFPRIIPSSIPDGPVEIRYDLPLNSLMPFKIERSRFFEILTEMEVRDA